MLSDLVVTVERLSDREQRGIDTDDRVWVHGSLQQRDRLVWAAEYGARWPGDFIEIGCLHGGTTIRLAPVAKENDRRIICLDPWVELEIYGPDPYGVFLENMKSWLDVLDIVKLSSMDPQAITQVEARPLVFAYVDGLHTYKACLSDIKTVSHCAGFIVVDDILWSAEVMRAFKDGAKAIGRGHYHSPLCREGYILPKEA